MNELLRLALSVFWAAAFRLDCCRLV